MPETSTAPEVNTTSSSRSIVLRCITCSTLNRIDLARLADKPKCSRCANALPLDRPLVVTDSDFQRFIDGSPLPVLVDFYADWCGPCKAMAPVLDAFAKQRSGSVLVLKMDTDANPVTAQRYRITSIPTLVVFRYGKEARRQSGAVPRAVLEALLA